MFFLQKPVGGDFRPEAQAPGVGQHARAAGGMLDAEADVVAVKSYLFGFRSSLRFSGKQLPLRC